MALLQRLSVLLKEQPSVETYSAGIGQEVGTNRLDIAVIGGGELADGLEVLLGGPALRQNRQWERNLNVSHGGVAVLEEEIKIVRHHLAFSTSAVAAEPASLFERT
jgi:hypothetical protein